MSEWKIIEKSARLVGRDTIRIGKASISVGLDIYDKYIKKLKCIEVYFNPESSLLGFKPSDDTTKGYIVAPSSPSSKTPNFNPSFVKKLEQVTVKPVFRDGMLIMPVKIKEGMTLFNLESE